MEPLCSYRPVAGPSFVASMPSRASWLQARVRNAVTEYRRGPWLTWPHRSIIFRYAAGHSSLYRCSTMPCSSQGSSGDRQRKTSSYTPSLAPIPPPRVLEEILWRRRSGISLGTPLGDKYHDVDGRHHLLPRRRHRLPRRRELAVRLVRAA